MSKSLFKLKLITDPGINIFFEKGTKGGISYISNRYSKDSNKYLKSYDPKQEPKQISFNNWIQMDRF